MGSSDADAARSALPNADALARVIESAHEAFISMDADGRVSAWNAEAEHTFGWTREEAVRRLLRDLIIPERYRVRHDGGLRRFLETGEALLLDRRIEIAALHRDGHEFPVELTISALDEGGSWTFHAFVHDISDRHRASELRERLALLVEHSADAIIGRTPDGRITSWNPGAERLFGYRAGEMLGETVDRLVPPERAGEANELIERVVDGDAVQGYETQRVCKDGSVLDVSITISPIRDDAGLVQEVSMIARDVTARKQAERALAEANRELERANELKSRFVAIASHELRTPLTSIYGFATTLARRWDRFDDAEKLTFLQTIEEQSGRLNRIVDDVLLLSRIESGRTPTDVTLVRPAELARSVIGELGLEGEARNEVDDALTVRADPGQLHQMLRNYLENARSYGRAPYVLCALETPDGTVICVEDAGDGVAPEFVPELFESFSQANPNGRGTGLGLAIVKRLAEAAGGHAWYEERSPRGARFCVSLPRP